MGNIFFRKPGKRKTYIIYDKVLYTSEKSFKDKLKSIGFSAKMAETIYKKALVKVDEQTFRSALEELGYSFDVVK